MVGCLAMEGRSGDRWCTRVGVGVAVAVGAGGVVVEDISLFKGSVGRDGRAWLVGGVAVVAGLVDEEGPEVATPWGGWDQRQEKRDLWLLPN